MRRARPWLAAVVSYLFITLALPLLNGASSNPSFSSHATWVVGVVAAMSGLMLSWKFLRRGLP